MSFLRGAIDPPPIPPSEPFPKEGIPGGGGGGMHDAG